jgi:hypothetical protein
MNLEQAEAVRADLDSRLFEARRSLDELDAKRRAISFAAHTGDADAKKTLDKLNKEKTGLTNSIEEIEAALAEAGRRVDEAERAAEMAAQSERAEKALEISSSLVARGLKIDQALRLVAEEAIALKNDIDALNRLGCTHPHAQQLFSFGSRALLAAVMGTPLQIEHLAPGERYRFEKLATDWAATVDRWAGPQIMRDAAE